MCDESVSWLWGVNVCGMAEFSYLPELGAMPSHIISIHSSTSGSSSGKRDKFSLGYPHI